MKGYTNFGDAFTIKSISEIKYMDWEKAKKICQENPWSMISAGLREDWNNTSSMVFESGEWIKDAYVYGCSCLATPILDVDGEEIECWTYEETSKNLPSWWGKE